MHLTLLAVFAAAVASSVVANPSSPSLNDLPVCAQQAGLAGISATGCGLTDISCICASVPFAQTLRAYIEQNCDAADQSSALTFAQTLCIAYGITISAVVTTSTPPAVFASTAAAPMVATAIATGTTVTSTLGVGVATTATATYTVSGAAASGMDGSGVPSVGVFRGGAVARRGEGAGTTSLLMALIGGVLGIVAAVV